MMERILELYELQFSDLMLLSSNEVPSSPEEIKRLETITKAVMENLGPKGPGLLAITGVPNASNRRRTLLTLARKLALLETEDRRRILKKHNLGSDVPLKNLNRSVSSFAMQLKYVESVESTNSKPGHKGDDNHGKKQNYAGVEGLTEFQDSEFDCLGSSFKQLGFCMMEMGLHLARVCDMAIGGRELEQSLLESFTAKGRLIHYHSTLDNLILKEAAKKNLSMERCVTHKFQQLHISRDTKRLFVNEEMHRSGNENHSNLWQQWHYDYGIFTVLTSPMFISPSHRLLPKSTGCSCVPGEQEFPYPRGHTHLQIFDPNKNCVLVVKASRDSFVVQVGESADILSKGKLRATLHSVCRPEKLEHLSRENFVVFLQPAWSKTLSLSDYPIKDFPLNDQSSGSHAEETCNDEQELNNLTQELHRVVPPLASRLKDGMTFAEFSQETTRLYYGGSGLQSKR